MDVQQRLSIKIKIAEREYPMQVDPATEGLLREAGKKLNEKILAYRTTFHIEDRQDLLSMVVFDCMVELLNQEKSGQDVRHSLLKKLDHWDELLSQALQID